VLNTKIGSGNRLREKVVASILGKGLIEDVGTPVKFPDV